jgi:hypothetical protein
MKPSLNDNCVFFPLKLQRSGPERSHQVPAQNSVTAFLHTIARANTQTKDQTNCT